MFRNSNGQRKHALINSLCYLLFPLAAFVFIGITWNNQEDRNIRKYLSMLLGFDVIAFSINLVVAVFFKLNGWPGGLEIAVTLHLILPLIIMGSSFGLIAYLKNQ